MPRGGTREGAGRPALGEDKAKPTQIKIPPALLDRIDAAAKEAGQNRTQWLLQAAEERLAGR